MITYEVHYSTVKMNKVSEIKFNQKKDALEFIENLKYTYKRELDYLALYQINYKKIEL